MSALLLATLDITSEVWQRLPPEKKKQIREQVKKGRIGLAKILTKNAKKMLKKKPHKKLRKY